MSGDAIYMDYYSTLGPIDPQVENFKGRHVPALGYLERYNELVDKAATPGALNMAELQILLPSIKPNSISLNKRESSL
jgi:hypothetical protein